MGSAILFTAAHMQAIEDATVTSMSVNGSGHLIVTRHDGSTFDAGDVSTWLPGRLKGANNLGAGNDPNTMLSSGWYAGTNWANSLLGYTFGIVEVLAYDANYIVQNFWTAGTTPRRLNRAMVGGVWTSWTEPDLVISASTAARGQVFLATDAETIAGTDTTKAVTPHAFSAGLGSGLTSITSRFHVGIIDPSWTSGTPNVTLEDGVTVVSALFSPKDVDIQPGAPVKLMQTSTGTWIIDSVYGAKPSFMKQIPIPFANGWGTYADTGSDVVGTFAEAINPIGSWNNNSALAGIAYACMTSTGIVSVQGLAARAGTTSATGQIIAGPLPVNMRPARTQVFGGYGNSGYFNVYVTPDGYIRLYNVNGNNAVFASLDVIRFRAASAIASGAATFVSIVSLLASPFTESTSSIGTGDSSGAGTHTPGYTYDSDGVYIFEGAIVQSAGTAANVAIATLPLVPATTESGTHQAFWNSASFAFGRYANAGGTPGAGGHVLQTGLALISGSTSYLSQFLYVDPNSLTTQKNVVTTLNTWATYPSWRVPGVYKTPDGLVIATGLLNASAANTIQANLAPGWMPRFNSIQAVGSNGALGRIDISYPLSGGTQRSWATSINFVAGSIGWVSWDGVSWPAFK